MAEVTAVATELQTILSALADVDQSSLSDYTPVAATKKVALLIVPFEQSGAMQYATVNNGASLVHGHTLVCEFWIKVSAGNVAAAMQRGRDICLQGLRLIAANPHLNGTVQHLGSVANGTQGQIGRYDVLPRYEEKGAIPYIVARLFVPFELSEPAPSW